MRSTISDDVFIVSPRTEYEGATPFFDIVVPGASTVTDDSTLEIVVSKNGKDVTSTRTSGSMAVANSTGSSPVVTTKTITGLVGGESLFILVRGTVDGMLRTIVCFWLYVKKESGRD